MDRSSLNNENARRLNLLASLKAIDGDLANISAKSIRELGVFTGGRGTYAPPVQDDVGAIQARVVLSVLHTGRHYSDKLSDESLIYHFPDTKIVGYDRSDIAAGKLAMELQLPIFVILSPPVKSPFREVRVGYILDVDDVAKQFLIGFHTLPVIAQVNAAGSPEPPFRATTDEIKKKRRNSIVRANDQPRFAFNVGKRYGPKCAFCQIVVPRLLDAAHIVGVAESGSDDPRNGLNLCKNHHTAFDTGLISIASDGRSIELAPGMSAESLGVTEQVIATATGALPHIEAVHLRRETLL